MKKLFTLLILIISLHFYAQEDRQKVIVEVSTGTWCPACPTVVNLLDNLKASGAEIAVLKYHINDSYQNSFSVARDNFYDFTWFPTTYYDGIRIEIGDWATYSVHQNLYQNRIDTESAFSITMVHQGDDELNLIDGILTIEKIGTNNATNLRAHIVITESDIQQNWQGETELDNVVRLMNANGLGEPLDFSTSSTIEIPFTFDLNPNWNKENLEITFFIQDHDTKEVLQGDYKEVEYILFNTTDFSSNLNAKVIPNPVENSFTIQTNNNLLISNINIYNILGEKVDATSSYQNTIDASKLASGVYFVHFEIDGKLNIEKFIKK